MQRLANLAQRWCVSALLSLGTCTLTANTPGTPYEGIALRNVFGLVPAQALPRETAPAPLAKIKLAGITTLGGKRALLDVRLSATPSDVSSKLSCILKEGERAGPVTALEIDEVGGSVKVDNNGTVMVVKLTYAPSTPAPPELPPLPDLKLRH